MMKQIFFSLFFATLAYTAFAQYKVTVSSTSGSYSTSKTVSFNVSWTNRLEGKYNSKVWILIDYSVPGSGVWSRATVTAVNAGSSGVTITAGGRGFWLQGNSGAYGQKVTVTLSGVPDKYNWCAHVSDCPPNVTASAGVYAFHGTPPFTLIAADGVTKQVVSGKTLAVTALTIAPKTLTDATDCPSTFCPYTGSDLLIDATHACRLRTSGTKNWEAWIKDSRDSKLYRIVRMSDNNWWLAQNVKLALYNSATVGGAIAGCTEDQCGRKYTWAEAYGAWGGTTGSTGNVQGVCPPGWLLPTRVEFNVLTSSIGNAATVCTALRAYNSGCSSVSDTYGFASLVGTVAYDSDFIVSTIYIEWYSNDAGREDGLIIDFNNAGYACNTYSTTLSGNPNPLCGVRCFRP